MIRVFLLCFTVLALSGAPLLAVAQESSGGAAAATTLPPAELKKWRALADKGNAKAQYRLGLMYATGQGLPRDHEEAVKWLQKAASQGLADAQNDLGVMYDNGLGVKRNHVEAAKWFEKAARQNHAKALTNLGLMYMKGLGVPHDYGEAVRWYRKATKKGYARAQYNLGFMYMKGHGVPQDYGEAVRWYRKAALQGYARAQHSLAFMYRYGRGVPYNYDEAVRWFTKAAEQGFVDSFNWLRLAAKQGHAGAQYSLAHLYGTGRGVARDEAEALKWFAESAEQGNSGAMIAQARLLATAKDDDVRDGKKAVELADRAMRTKRTADSLDTLAAAYAEVGRYDDALWQEICELGWPGIAVAADDGGQDLGMVELAILCEEIGYACAPVPFLSNAAGGLALLAAGSAEQRERFLAGSASGESRGTVGLASSTGNGGVPLVPDAVGATFIVLIDATGARLLDGAKVEVAETESIDPTRSYATVTSADGEKLSGDVARARDTIAVAVAAELTGIAQRAMDMAVAYAKERHQFDRPIGAYQAVSHTCAGMLYDVEESRSLTYYAAWAADAEPEALPLAAAMAKARASEAAWDVVKAALQVHGGIGFTWEHDLHFLLKRARVGGQLFGTAGEHRDRVAALSGLG